MTPILEDCLYRRVCDLYVPEHCFGEAVNSCGLYYKREKSRLAQLTESLNCDCIGSCDAETIKRLGRQLC